MANTNYFQCNFTMGEVSPELYNRLDTDQYKAAAKKVTNGVPIPQGGITKRRGFERLLELDTPTGEFVKLIPLEFSEEDKYICLLRMNGTFHFYNMAGHLIQTITPVPRETVSGEYTEKGTKYIRGTDIKDVQYATSMATNEVFLTHPLYPILTIKRESKGNFTVARTIFYKADPPPPATLEEPPVAPDELLTWTPNLTGGAYLSFPVVGYYPTAGPDGGNIYTTEFSFDYDFLETDIPSAWYPIVPGFLLYFDSTSRKVTKIATVFEAAITPQESKGRITVSSTVTKKFAQQGTTISVSKCTVYFNGREVWTYGMEDLSSVGVYRLSTIGFSPAHGPFRGIIYDISFKSTAIIEGYPYPEVGIDIPAKIVSTTQPTTTTVQEGVTLVSPADPPWVSFVPYDTSNPDYIPPFKGYTPVLAPSDNFGYTRYILSPWHIQLLQFSAFENGDTFSLKFDGSEKTHTLTYKLNHVEITSATEEGDYVGDDATPLVTAIQEANTTFGIPSTTVVKALYNEKVQRIITKVDGKYISLGVIVREFRGVQVIFTTMDLTAPNRYWVSSKSRYDANVLVRPAGGKLEYVPLDQQEDYKGELAWSESRGYPATSIVHGGRSVFGGSYAKPLTLWFTQSGLNTHFSPDALEEPLANDSIVMTLNSKFVGSISGMVSGRTLMVITNNSMFSVTGENNVISPLSASAKLEVEHGSKYVRPVFMDNKNFYIHADTATLNSTSYDYTKDSYLVSVESLFSPHLMRDISEMAIVDSLSQANATYLVLKNNQGGLSTYSSIGEQGITSWSRFETDGFVRAMASLSENLFILVRRGEKYFLEVMSPTSPYADNSSVIESEVPVEYISELTHLVGKELSVLADGYPLSVVVEEGGYIALPFPAHRIEYGLPIPFELETLPPPIALKGAPFTAYRKKRVSSVKVDLMDSLGVSIGYCDRDYAIQDREMGGLFEAPQPYSGVFKKNLVGWSTEGTVSIKNKSATPITVLAVEKEVRLKG